MPITAFIFGGRTSRDMPLVFQAFNWAHGVYMRRHDGLRSDGRRRRPGAAMRRDPMAMLPFCGYNMADYFGHWLDIGRKIPNPPRIFRVNWFRRDDDGKFLWPGFGENMRVLKWIVERVHGRAVAIESPLGWMPRLRGHRLDRARLLGGEVPRADGGRSRGRHRRGPRARGAVRQVPRSAAQGVHPRAGAPAPAPVAISRALGTGARGRSGGAGRHCHCRSSWANRILASIATGKTVA